MPSIVGHASMYEESCYLYCNQKYKLNENRFHLRTKIPIKRKIRDKKKYAKKVHGGQFSEGNFAGPNFPGDNLSESIFLGRGGVIFPEGTFPRTLSKLVTKNAE